MKRFAVTMGDASGVGPEIILRSYAGKELKEDIVVYGDLSILQAGAKLLHLHAIRLNAIDDPRDARDGFLNVVDQGTLNASDFTPGKLNKAAGSAARDYVIRAVKDALADKNAGLVTLPMNKEATQLTSPHFCGHTELIADLCHCTKFSMMLATAKIACTHVSTHCSMQKSIERCKTPRILEVIELTDHTLSRFLEKPRIAVCGLNPHAGENGLFGFEDAQQIRPAVEKARAMGIDAEGPLPADTVFYQAVCRHRYDGIVCMYHDQGHAPMKLIAFETGVNVTIGLPIIRTSVDHGTAFDIAWQGKAFTHSLHYALDYARLLASKATQSGAVEA